MVACVSQLDSALVYRPQHGASHGARPEVSPSHVFTPFVRGQVVRAGALFLREASTDPETQVRLGQKGVDPNHTYPPWLKTLTS